MALKRYVNTIFGGKLYHGTLSITFSEQDLEMIKLPHADLLVIKLQIGNVMVSRVLVDGGRSSDILFWEAFQRIMIDKEMIRLVKTSLHAFNGLEVKPLGVVALQYMWMIEY